MSPGAVGVGGVLDRSIVLASWYNLVSFMIKIATASTPKEVRWNILLLRSFQMFHQNPSNLAFCFLSKERRIRLHQELIACEDDICRSGLPICDIRSIQTF
jgi:hypothetical protein